MGKNTKKPKILFVALAHSSHTLSWINLLKGKDFDVRVFGCKGTKPPPDFEFHVYSAAVAATRRVFYAFFLLARWGVSFLLGGRKIKWFSSVLFDIIEFFDEVILTSAIKKWKPDVIHTLGLEPASFLYLWVKKRYKLDNTWVVTLRGGPEFALNRLIPEKANEIKKVFQACDQIIADNKQNYNYVKEMGIDESKLSPLGVVPGTGGIDVDELSSLRKEAPSKQRLILWPKAYECPASKALPVYEALRLCWDKIKPCEIYMTAMIPETRLWFETLPQEIKTSCHCMDRIPRNELLELMAKSRVLLSPSLTDGIPNSLYEAMAAGAFPIVSPIETLQGVVFETENVLFARNLYPHEIAEALVRAMNDDELVDTARDNNLKLVKKLADRDIIRERVESYYRRIAFKI